ncbi:MAG: flagellar basal body L-ring protein FlgH, partial [Aeromonas veronii]
VTSDNSVSSQKVANARIYYGGTGDLANSQEQGWLTSFFNGPWWPL